jgi:hypothetical protein
VDDHADEAPADRVLVIRWPLEAERHARAVIDGLPRLVLVERGDQPPPQGDPLEDWMWVPDDAVERQARLATLTARWHAARIRRPRLDPDGRLHVGPSSIPLPPRVARAARVLVERFDQVVPRQELAAAAWEGRAVGDDAVHLVVHRLRQRIEPLGLTITSVRGRGVALTWTTGPPDPSSP